MPLLNFAIIKNYFFKIIIILILSFFYFTKFHSKNSNTRFIVTGHLYPIMKDEKLKKFIEK